MCAAALQSTSYWNPVEKLILHLSPVTRRKAVKDQGLTRGPNNNNAVKDKKIRRGRRTHSEPSADNLSNRSSVESIPNHSVPQQPNLTLSNNICCEDDKYVHSKFSGQNRGASNGPFHNQKDTNHVPKVGGHSYVPSTTSTSYLPISSPRNHRSILLRRTGCANHAPKASFNSSSSNSLSSPTSGSASSENDDPSLFSNEVQTMKCHSLFKVCELSY